MKRYASILCVIAMVVAVGACKKGAVSTTETPTPGSGGGTTPTGTTPPSISDCVERPEGELDCTSINLEDMFHCSSIRVLPNAVEDLDPVYPMVICYLFCPDDDPKIAAWCNEAMADPDYGVYRYGGLGHNIFTYIYIDAQDQFKLIKNKDEFKALFQPVSSGDEAIAFAVAMTGDTAKTDTSLPEGCTEILGTMKTTAATPMSDPVNAYAVNLYDTALFGCGDHEYMEFVYTVTQNGDVTEASTSPICNDPRDDGSCID